MNLFSVKALCWEQVVERDKSHGSPGRGHLWLSQARDVVVHIQHICQDPFHLDTYKVPCWQVKTGHGSPGCGHLWLSQPRDVVVHIQHICQDPFHLDTKDGTWSRYCDNLWQVTWLWCL